MENTMGSLKNVWIGLILSALKVITITSFVILTILISANVFVRFFPIASLHWFDEIIELLYAYLVFYGAAALWITHEPFWCWRLDWGKDHKKCKGKAFL